MGFEPQTFRPAVRRANHYATGAGGPVSQNELISGSEVIITGDKFSVLNHQRKNTNTVAFLSGEEGNCHLIPPSGSQWQLNAAQNMPSSDRNFSDQYFIAADICLGWVVGILLYAIQSVCV